MLGWVWHHGRGREWVGQRDVHESLWDEMGVEQEGQKLDGAKLVQSF